MLNNLDHCILEEIKKIYFYLVTYVGIVQRCNKLLQWIIIIYKFQTKMR